jgi:predicted phosphodiesterase
MIAILADIHANRPALAAVLAEAKRRGAAELILLGDVVGYHAEPDGCVELLSGWRVSGVVGNHDLAALGVPDRYASRAATAIQGWTAAHLGEPARAFLAALPRRLALPWAIATHATFTHPDAIVGYVTPVTAAANLDAVAAAGHSLGLFGHSHVPALHVRGVDRVGLASGRIALPRETAIVNPGSVGQPRDGDPRASFALIDPEARVLEVVRVPYDVEATASAMRAAGLDDAAIDRLREAR